jgi:Na+/phosphate symporter
MNKKLTSTLLLFAVCIGFFLWGIAMLVAGLSTKVKDGESIVYALLILTCSFVALVAILKLPRKQQR